MPNTALWQVPGTANVHLGSHCYSAAGTLTKRSALSTYRHARYPEKRSWITAVDASWKILKTTLSGKVTLRFENFPCTSISYVSKPRPTGILGFRVIGGRFRVIDFKNKIILNQCAWSGSKWNFTPSSIASTLAACTGKVMFWRSININN